MTHEQKKKALDRAIKEMQRQFKVKPNVKFSRHNHRFESDPNGLAHDEYCEDMKAIGEYSGNPWGGRHKDTF